MEKDELKDELENELEDEAKDEAKDIENYMNEDKILYKEFLDGNLGSLETLIKKYKTEIVYFIHNIIKDFYAAEDVSQEVFVYLLQHKEVYNIKYSFRTYLYTIAKSRALNYIKARKKVEFISETEEKSLAYGKDMEEDIFKSDESIMVRRNMKKLKEDYQLAIYLIDLQDFSYEEAGVVMKKSPRQIKALIFNARKRLREFLKEEIKMGGEHSEVNG